ncbi:MAG: FMN-binding protein [Spirochaetota bacterium]
MKKKGMIFTVVFIIIFLIIFLIGIKYFQKIERYKNQVEQITINEIDLSNIEDGTYYGSYNTIFVSAKVEVIVKDHKILDIKIIEHINGKGKPAETIINDVIKEQKLNVDIVSGATASSKVILKAIEEALSKKM